MIKKYQLFLFAFSVGFLIVVWGSAAFGQAPNLPNFNSNQSPIMVAKDVYIATSDAALDLMKKLAPTLVIAGLAAVTIKSLRG